MLFDDGNDLKMQLEKCARKLDVLGDNVQLSLVSWQLTNVMDDLYAI